MGRSTVWFYMPSILNNSQIYLFNPEHSPKIDISQFNRLTLPPPALVHPLVLKSLFLFTLHLQCNSSCCWPLVFLRISCRLLHQTPSAVLPASAVSFLPSMYSQKNNESSLTYVPALLTNLKYFSLHSESSPNSLLLSARFCLIWSLSTFPISPLYTRGN